MFEHISKPTLIVDERKCKANISEMLAKAKKNQLEFRPHFKTHQSIEIGRWFREFGIHKITVSSMDMAVYFASDGWDDITVAFPVNWREINKINGLGSKIKLNLLVESVETIEFLSKNLTYPAGVFIKIDAGYQRTGIPVAQTEYIGQLIHKINRSGFMKFEGLLVHNGHTYQAGSVDEIKEIHRNSLIQLADLKKSLSNLAQPIHVSIGDTPSSSICDQYEGISEIRPGNFVFYDLVQQQLGSCNYKDIAVSMACPVVAKHPNRRNIIIYGGGVHFSKEFLSDTSGQKIYGRIVLFTESGWSEPLEGCILSSVSQEHGIVDASETLMKSVKIGDLIGVLPVHSCMTANLQSSYQDCHSNVIKNFRDII